MGVGPVGIVVGVGEKHDGPRRLCEPVRLDELAAEGAQRCLQHFFGYRRRAVEDGNEAREVGLPDSRCHQQELQYRGHEHRVGDAVAGMSSMISAGLTSRITTLTVPKYKPMNA